MWPEKAAWCHKGRMGTGGWQAWVWTMAFPVNNSINFFNEKKKHDYIKTRGVLSIK